MEVAPRWTETKAWDWYKAQGWRMGANFVPSTASNQLEMWQQDYWNASVIGKELAWASSMKFNTVRVFLHDLVWEHEGEEYLDRIDQFLEICASHEIRPMFVFWEGCWDPNPHYGKQTEPRPHVHNSRWVQSPGKTALQNEIITLKPYIQSVLRRFGNDSRVLLWDLFNEPDNPNTDSYGFGTFPRVPAAADAAGTEMRTDDKVKYSLRLLNSTMSWAREVGPLQTPLTVPFYGGEDPSIQDWIVDNVDVISFHHYGALPGMMNQTKNLLQTYKRPVICTEYMARPVHSTFNPILGYLYSEGVWAFNWGLVSGRSQTIYPWDSWTTEYDAEPQTWFHDVLRADGTPYSDSEYHYIGQVRSITGIWSLLKISTQSANVWPVMLALALLEVCFALLGLRNLRRRRVSAKNSFEYESRSRVPTLTDEEEEYCNEMDHLELL
jgi:hypothetical protein